MLESFDLSWLVLLRRVVSAICMALLAAKFGRSLFRDRAPVIEQIARVSTPDLSPGMRSYARFLTIIWCVYFAGAAVFAGWGNVDLAWEGLVILCFSILLFVGEFRLRPYLFPDQKFPTMLRQLKDTWAVWRLDSSFKASDA